VTDETRFLRYTGTDRRGFGLGHQLGNLEALVREAALLGRVPVAPVVTLAGKHNGGVPLRSDPSPYVDLDRVRVRRSDGASAESIRLAREAPAADAPLRISHRHRVSPEENARHRVIVRDVSGGWSGLWARRRPSLPREGGLSVEWSPAPSVASLAERVADELGSFAAVHVRAGDRRWHHPTLWYWTHPRIIRRTLRKVLPPGTRLYLLADDLRPSYLKLLRDDYTLLRYHDVEALRELPSPPDPDNFLLYAVEREVMARAEIRIPTFRVPGHAHSLSPIPGWS